ncbi:DMT family transporter [Vibrio sp. S11_S32]|uniref:EamA family transporter n=1 Tax=Vibrio sp. S11_S32 TaxID=2720225 RepID=UPI001680581A|nr:DMT family transporter [Vibrio sp. S11_S32]
MYLGEITAIAAALVWASSTWLYGQCSHHFSALQLNMIKGVLASTMMLLVMPLLPLPELHISSKYIGVLAVSGMVGIAVGDSAYFAALKRIGPNRTLLLESLAPPLSGVLALALLGTSIGLQSWLGIIITTLAVAFTLFQVRTSATMRDESVSRSGIGFGVLASFCQAFGVVISHYALVEGNLPPLLGAFIRLSIGVLSLMLVVGFIEPKPFSSILQGWKQLKPRAMWVLLAAIFFGTFIALWLQQVALKFANPAVAQTLMSTSPLFILMISFIKGESISARTLIGTLMALGGIALFFL